MPQYVKYNAQTVLVVTVPEMVQCGVSEKYIVKKALPGFRAGENSCWPHHKEGIVYIHVDGLKDKYKELIREKLCGGQDIVEYTRWHYIIAPELILCESDAEVIKRFELPDGRRLSLELEKQYKEQCKWLNLLVRLERGAAMKRFLGVESNSEFYSIVMPYLQRCNLPSSYNRLRINVRDYKKFGAAAVISSKVGNKNKNSITDTAQVAVLWKLASHHNNLGATQIAKRYNVVASANGWPQICSRTAWNWCERLRANIIPGSRGNHEFERLVSMQVKRANPTEPLKFVSIDGWDVELRYQQTIVTKKGYTKTIYDNRQKVIVVLDPYTDYPLGWAIDDTENTTVIKQAVKNAIAHTRELFGEYHKIYQGQTDRFGSGELTEMYNNVFKHYTPARAGNAKAKKIEPYFNHINKNHCQYMPNWTGFGMESRKENRPNRDYMSKTPVLHMIPDKTENTKQINAIFEAERAAKLEKYISRYKFLKQEERLIIKREEFLMIFGETTGYTNELTARGVMPTINGIKYSFDCFSQQFRRLTHIDWTVVFDKDDMSSALAIGENGKYRFLLEQKYVQPMALADRVEGDSQQLQRIFDFNAAQKDSIMSENDDYLEAIEEMVRQNPLLGKTLMKNMPVYNGQQKRVQEAVKNAFTSPDDNIKEYNRTVNEAFNARAMASPTLLQILNKQIPDNNEQN